MEWENISCDLMLGFSFQLLVAENLKGRDIY